MFPWRQSCCRRCCRRCSRYRKETRRDRNIDRTLASTNSSRYCHHHHHCCCYCQRTRTTATRCDRVVHLPPTRTSSECHPVGEIDVIPGHCDSKVPTVVCTGWKRQESRWTTTTRTSGATTSLTMMIKVLRQPRRPGWPVPMPAAASTDQERTLFSSSSS